MYNFFLECGLTKIGVHDSDVIFPGLFEFPENREFPGIQANFPGIPGTGNLLKTRIPPDIQAIIS